MSIDTIKSALKNRILIALTASVFTFSSTVYTLAEKSFEEYIIDANRETLESVMKSVIDISLSMPRNTTFGGFATAKNDDDVIIRVERWINNGNSARTGALKTMCMYDEDSLLRIMQQNTMKIICRMLK